MLVAFAFLVASALTTAWAVTVQEARRNAEDLAALTAAKREADRLETKVPEAHADKQAHLPKFVSHQFAAQFNETALSVGLPVDEVGYKLENDDSTPYTRYRLSMSVKTRYLDVRKFIAALASEMPHVSLDTIHCIRENAAALPLSCQLGFSAFFAKD